MFYEPHFVAYAQSAIEQEDEKRKRERARKPEALMLN